MKQDHEKFVAKGVSIVVVTPHDVEKVGKYFSSEKLPFYGIPDPDKKIGTLYGQQWHLIKLGLMPALFVVDTAGTIAFVHYSASMADIPSNNTMLDLLSSDKRSAD